MPKTSQNFSTKLSFLQFNHSAYQPHQIHALLEEIRLCRIIGDYERSYQEGTKLIDYISYQAYEAMLRKDLKDQTDENTTVLIGEFFFRSMSSAAMRLGRSYVLTLAENMRFLAEKCHDYAAKQGDIMRGHMIQYAKMCEFFNQNDFFVNSNLETINIPIDKIFINQSVYVTEIAIKIYLYMIKIRESIGKIHDKENHTQYVAQIEGFIEHIKKRVAEAFEIAARDNNILITFDLNFSTCLLICELLIFTARYLNEYPELQEKFMVRAMDYCRVGAKGLDPTKPYTNDDNHLWSVSHSTNHKTLDFITTFNQAFAIITYYETGMKKVGIKFQDLQEASKNSYYEALNILLMVIDAMAMCGKKKEFNYAIERLKPTSCYDYLRNKIEEFSNTLQEFEKNAEDKWSKLYIEIAQEDEKKDKKREKNRKKKNKKKEKDKHNKEIAFEEKNNMPTEEFDPESKLENTLSFYERLSFFAQDTIENSFTTKIEIPQWLALEMETIEQATKTRAGITGSTGTTLVNCRNEEQDRQDIDFTLLGITNWTEHGGSTWHQLHTLYGAIVDRDTQKFKTFNAKLRNDKGLYKAVDFFVPLCTGETFHEWRACDLQSRAFTLNSLIIDKNGIVHAPPEWIEDARNNHVRAIRDPKEIFKEDPLRMFLAIYLHVAKGATLDLQLDADIKTYEHLPNPLSENYDRQRLLRGIFKIIKKIHEPEITTNFIEMAGEYGLLRKIFQIEKENFYDLMCTEPTCSAYRGSYF